MKVSIIYRTVQRGDRIGKKILLGKARSEWCCSVLIYKYRKGPKHIEKAPEIQTSCKPKSRVGCQILDLKLLTASRGEIACFHFLEPCCGRQVCSEASSELGVLSMPASFVTYQGPQRLMQNCPRHWVKSQRPLHLPQTLGNLHLITDIETSWCYLSDILSDHWHNYLSVLWGSHLCTAIHWFLYQKQEDCNPNGQAHWRLIPQTLSIYIFFSHTD